MNPKSRFPKTVFKVLTAAFSLAALTVLTSCAGLGGPFPNINNQNAAQDLGMQTYTVVRGSIFEEADFQLLKK